MNMRKIIPSSSVAVVIVLLSGEILLINYRSICLSSKFYDIETIEIKAFNLLPLNFKIYF
jgi:hypothetical protein